jgi:hypothetical protein
VNLQAAGGKKEIKKTFKNITTVRFKGMNSDCVIKKGSGGETTVHVVYYSDSDIFKPKMKEDGETLVLRDGLGGSNGEKSLWTIIVPPKIEVKSSSITGDFSVEGLESDCDVKTVSGSIKARDCKGEVDLVSTSGVLEAENLEGEIDIKGMSNNIKAEKLRGEIDINTAAGSIDAKDLDGEISLKTAAGDIKIKQAEGEFKVKVASGNIKAFDITLRDDSDFKVASGNVEIILAESAAHDLELASAMGNAVLDYNGNPVKGKFEFTALLHSGKIISPFAFDKEEEEDKWGKKYMVKSFTKGGDEPKIRIKTATGKAVLKK